MRVSTALIMPGLDPIGDDEFVDRTRRDLALAGAVTGIVGVVVAEAATWMLRVQEGPVLAVAGAVRDRTPGRMAIRLVHLVGHLDKPLLVAGTVLVLVALTAWAGTLARLHGLFTDLVFFALAGVGLLAVLHLEHPSLAAGLTVVVGLITWIVVFRFLATPILGAPTAIAPPRAEPDGTDRPAEGGADAAPETATSGADRRRFLQRIGMVGAGAAAAAVLGRLSGRSRRRVEQARRLLRLSGSTGRVPDGANLPGVALEPWRTPNEHFYLIDTALVPPSVSPNDWTLRIHGMVDRPLTIGYDKLVERSLTEAWVTLCCVSNPVGGDLIGNAWWSGVPVRELLAEAGVRPGADAVLQTSHDGWTCGTPLAALTDDRNALLAVEMNGQPLPIEHGFPVRMVVPGLYGYVSATKWLVDLEVTRFDRIDAYWTKRGWSELGPVRTQSRIDVPRSHATVAAGSVPIGGVAWAQHTGIERVEFQIDGGPWQRAELGTVPGADTWVQWAGRAQVAPGDHVVAVRATDRSGYTQTAVRTDVAPSGATGWHTIGFKAE